MSRHVFPKQVTLTLSYLLTYITYLGVEVVREVLCTCGVMPEVASQVKEYHVVHGKGLDVVVM